ncbi:MAG: hypothetical protein IPP40_16150 [bacterium]|nr:hypothetical protein [bacterium]
MTAFGERGENVEILISLNNLGEDALNVTATLSTTDTNVTITDATSAMGNILFSTTVDNSTDVFAATLGLTAPLDHTTDFTLTVTADSGYSVELGFTLDSNPSCILL